MLAFSEGVLLAERGGVDREAAVEVMTGSAIGSPMLQARAPLVLDLPEEAWFDIRLMQKDLRLALETAHPASAAPFDSGRRRATHYGTRAGVRASRYRRVVRGAGAVGNAKRRPNQG